MAFHDLNVQLVGRLGSSAVMEDRSEPGLGVDRRVDVFYAAITHLGRHY